MYTIVFFVIPTIRTYTFVFFGIEIKIKKKIKIKIKSSAKSADFAFVMLAHNGFEFKNAELLGNIVKTRSLAMPTGEQVCCFS